MIINFDKMEEMKIPNFNGGEKEFALKLQLDEVNKILCGRLIPGASIGMHAHAPGCEVIYIISGSGKFVYDGVEERIEAGQCHYCPEGHSHSLINDGEEDLVFFAVVQLK